MSRNKDKSQGLENLKETKADTCVDLPCDMSRNPRMKSEDSRGLKGRKQLKIGSNLKSVCGPNEAVYFIFIIPDTLC